jgi:hypothetical protein
MASATAKYIIRLEDKTKRAFKAIGKSLKKVTKAIFSMKTGFISAAGIAGIGYFVKKSMNATDEMAKMSRAIGVSVEELQALRHAAALGGLQSTQLDKAVQKLAINMADMSRGVGLAKDVFEKHNIRVTEMDGSLRSVIDVMNDVADVTATMTNETEKADLAYKLFGARGAKMINMLNGGSEAMQAAMKEAKELGLVMSGDTAKGVEDANDAITRLGSFLTSSFTRAVAELAPAIEAITVSIMKWVNLKVKEEGGIGAIATSMANAIIMATMNILQSLENLGNGVIKFTRDMKLLLGFGDEFDQLTADLEGLKDVRDNFDQGIIAGEDDFMDRLTGYGLKIKETLGFFTDTDTTKNIMSDLDQQIADVTAQLDAMKKTGGATLTELNFQDLISALDATLKIIPDLEDEIIGVTDATKELDTALGMCLAPDRWVLSKAAFETYKNSIITGQQFIANTTTKLMQGTEDAIMAMIMGVKFSWKSLFKGIMADLIRIQVRKAIVGAIGGIFGFANGGRPPSNRPSIVGEKGAELFVPDSAGTIVPNDQIGGGNTTAEINFNVQAIDASSFNSFLVNNRDTIESIVNNSILTNGSVRRTIQMTS